MTQKQQTTLRNKVMPHATNAQVKFHLEKETYARNIYLRKEFKTFALLTT